jgi:hypothetical protein
VKKMLEFCAAYHRQSLAMPKFVDDLETREVYHTSTVMIRNEAGK